jgi:hypothetical protein
MSYVNNGTGSGNAAAEVAVEKARAEGAEAERAKASEVAPLDTVAATENANRVPSSQLLYNEIIRAKAAEEALVTADSYLFLPDLIPTYKNNAEVATENLPAIAESVPGWIGTTTHALTSGTPSGAAVLVPAGKEIKAIGFFVSALEATPANRTHLWGAVLDATTKLPLGKTADYTSSVNTPLEAAEFRALKLTAPIAASATRRLVHVILCDVVSSGTPLTITKREATSGVVNNARTIKRGVTTPGSMAGPSSLAEPTTITSSSNTPYLLLI